jgi:hypothetical protein
MWEPWHLTPLWAFMSCYRNTFTCTLSMRGRVEVYGGKSTEHTNSVDWYSSVDYYLFMPRCVIRDAYSLEPNRQNCRYMSGQNERVYAFWLYHMPWYGKAATSSCWKVTTRTLFHKLWQVEWVNRWIEWIDLHGTKTKHCFSNWHFDLPSFLIRFYAFWLSHFSSVIPFRAVLL